MPFRQRVKRVFGRTPSTTDSDLTKTSSRKSSIFYQPGEQMPRPKYRQPVDKQHKATLDAFNFSFGIDGRKKSIASTYSPMGSKWPSRQNSFDHGTFAYGRRHPPSGMLADARLDQYSIDSTDSKSTQHLENASVSSSDTETHQPLTATITAPDHKPFSEHDLHQALERSTSRGQSGVVVV